MSEDTPLGAVLAGGESSRYGAPKALAKVGGVRIIDRVVDALRHVTPDLAISANEPGLFADLGLPILPDARERLGPLGGIYTLLVRARAEGRPGILAVACDMPFPSPALLTLLAWRGFRHGNPPAPVEPGDPGSDSDSGSDSGSGGGWLPDVVVPASGGRRGIEPLFAAYSVRCIPAIDAALDAGDRRMIGFHDRVSVHTIPLVEVEAVCDPGRAFLNVNTREDRERAEWLVERDEHDEGGG